MPSYDVGSATGDLVAAVWVFVILRAWVNRKSRHERKPPGRPAVTYVAIHRPPADPEVGRKERALVRDRTETVDWMVDDPGVTVYALIEAAENVAVAENAELQARIDAGEHPLGPGKFQVPPNMNWDDTAAWRSSAALEERMTAAVLSALPHRTLILPPDGTIIHHTVDGLRFHRGQWIRSSCEACGGVGCEACQLSGRFTKKTLGWLDPGQDEPPS